MKKQFFSNEKDGFYGTYYENPKGANCAMIGLFGDDPNDFMAKCGAKWLHKNGVNVMCMSPDVKNYGHVNFPLERIETAIKWLKSHGNKKIGIMGMSTAGMDSLVAASYFPDITLTFGLTPGLRSVCRGGPILCFRAQGYRQDRQRFLLAENRRVNHESSTIKNGISAGPFGH